MDLPNATNNTSFTHPTSSLLKDNNPQQSPPNNAANGHLVYVRRKSEGETPKNDNTTLHVSCDQHISPPKSHLKDTKLSTFPPFPPFPIPADSNHVPPSSQHTIANPPKLFQNVHWEERYQQLQMFLRKLDQSNQAHYIQLLQSLSSVELSRHAVELEKRSIQLSLEEAKELQRVAALNVLGKSVKNFKAPADHGECSDKLKTST